MFYVQLLFQTLPGLSRKLSSNLLEACHTYVLFLFFLCIKKIKRRSAPWIFEFRYMDMPLIIKLFEGSIDIAALKEIFIDGEYSWDKIQDPKIIIDIGAHTGNTAIYFHQKYPTAKIYAVEASLKNYEHLKENVKNISEIIPILGAVADRDGTIDFYECESSLGSSLQKRDNLGLSTKVRCFTLSTLLREYNISSADFIKIDIEGGEEKIFIDKFPDLFSTHYIIEVHNDLMNMDIDFENKYFKSFSTTKRPLKNPKRYLLYAYK